MTGRTVEVLENRAIAAYWGLALGDALGATVEFMTPREIQHEYGVHEHILGGGWLRLKKGQVTDDTEMSLALGDAVLEEGGVDPLTVAHYFDAWLRSKPVDIGQTVRRGIVHFRNTGVPRVAESTDAGNGACMRLLPVALLTFNQSSADIEAACHQQAHVTHRNADSDAACETVIGMIHGAFAGMDKTALLQGPVAELLRKKPAFRFRQRRMDNPSAWIIDTLKAVLQAFMDTDSFSDCLIDVVNRGGDADTTGAIAGMIAGAYYGLDALPGAWLSSLDPVIKQRCRDQAIALTRLPAASGVSAGEHCLMQRAVG